MLAGPKKGRKTQRDTVEARGGFVGSRVYVDNGGWIERRAKDDGNDDWNTADVEKNHRGETPKRGTACGIQFDALAYPKADFMVSYIICDTKWRKIL